MIVQATTRKFCRKADRLLTRRTWDNIGGHWGVGAWEDTEDAHRAWEMEDRRTEDEPTEP